MRGRRPASFAEVIEVLDQLPSFVTFARRARRLNLRQAAERSGVPFNTLSRIERGADCSLSNVKLIMQWLDEAAP